MSELNPAVFLSHASPAFAKATASRHDAEAARRIADSLPPSLKRCGETRRAMPQR